jgi:hypothetical protein
VADDVKAALTPEEWESKSYEHGFSAARIEDGELRVTDSPGTHYIQFGSEDRHALAALALYEQPFGFTWDDLIAMYAAIRAAERAGPYGDDLANVLRPIRDKIAALLPPR